MNESTEYRQCSVVGAGKRRSSYLTFKMDVYNSKNVTINENV
jgi:hypothetical protein